MKKITGMIENALIEMYTSDDNGEQIVLNFRYMPRLQSWIMDVKWKEFIANGIRVSAHPNILNKYKNIIDFGLSCQTTDGYDPYFLDDFVSGRCTLYLLSPDEVKKVGDYLDGNV